MQLVRWLGFGFSNSVTRTVVHFFPSAGNVTAPYPAQCKLSIFGAGLDRRSVVLDGARFSQPDGVKLDLAFPALQEGFSGPFGLEVEITTSQPRQDLWCSFCVVELVSASPSVRYLPRQVCTEGEDLCIARVGLMKRDAFSNSSVIVVNGSSALFKPSLSGLSVEGVPPGTATEVESGESFYKDVEPLECSWGLCRAAGIQVGEDFPIEAAYFVLYRDSGTRRPVSVVAL